MKVEIHSHTDVYSPCSRIRPRELVAMAELSGYDAVFVTDHDRVWPPSDLAALQRMSDRVRVYPAIERALPDRRDLLILGAAHLDYERLRTPEELLARACTDGFITVLAHPFRWHQELPAFAPAVDAVEVLTCNHPRPEWEEQALHCADEHHLAPVVGSDAHGINFMNRFWIETEGPFNTPQEFRRLILSGRYRNVARRSDDVLPPGYKAAAVADLPDHELSSIGLGPLG